MNRPASLTVFGILNLVFAGWGVLGVLMSAAMLLMPRKLQQANPVLDIMRSSPDYMLFQQVVMVLAVIASLVLAVAGVGLLKARSWGRLLSIGWAVYAILMAVVGTAASYYFLLQPLMEEAARRGGGPEAAGMVGGAVAGTAGNCLALIYPVFLLFFMFRPNVAAACRPWTAMEGPGAEGSQWR